MKRTQIYLSPAQYDYFNSLAKKNNSSLSEEIRNALDIVRKELNSKRYDEPQETTGEWILRMADEAEKWGPHEGPKDLAENIDKYLYDDEMDELESKDNG